ncbi:MlaC/ttg2D family ABC transporter substrate-binding protein [Ferrimonas lipolytica]|uniref:Toluene tolerance protein n=1 Tax=Ferrimonas lipolytica TaxID=2724191 RepID=A0A6H1UHU3_9GAMM|nr:ABC transporter substrate-binding protein [Ferrimonas lipolytica]QIZ77883.1 toluene tolerance protein [Ferrimonas lipolytica]
MLSRWLLLGLLSIGWVSTAQATVDQSNPYSMVEEVAAVLLSHYRSEQELLQREPQQLRPLVEEHLMPYVNHTYASYKVMGKAVRKASPEQRQRFTDEFRQYMIGIFANAFTIYTDQTISYEPKKPLGDRGIVNVGVTFDDGKRAPIEVKFKMRLNKKSGQWQAIDLIAEGASILAAKESEFDGLIRKQGLDEVINMLAEKNRQAVQPAEAPAS